MGHVGLTCPFLHHLCTLSLVPRLTLTATLRKATEEGKIRSYLINLGTGTDAHKHKKKLTSTEETHANTEVAISCTCAQSVYVCTCVLFCFCSRELGQKLHTVHTILKQTSSCLFLFSKQRNKQKQVHIVSNTVCKIQDDLSATYGRNGTFSQA